MQKSLNSCGGDDDGEKKNLRGKSLKELEGFFLLHDHDSDFGGLRKNVAPDGALMWCSESEGKLLLEGGAGGEGTGGEGVGDSERADMASKIALLEQKLQEANQIEPKLTPPPPPLPQAGKEVEDNEEDEEATTLSHMNEKLENLQSLMASGKPAEEAGQADDENEESFSLSDVQRQRLSSWETCTLGRGL